MSIKNLLAKQTVQAGKIKLSTLIIGFEIKEKRFIFEETKNSIFLINKILFLFKFIAYILNQILPL